MEQRTVDELIDELNGAPPIEFGAERVCKAQLLYRCTMSNRPAWVALRGDREWLEGFTRFRLRCCHCGQRHIVPACLVFTDGE